MRYQVRAPDAAAYSKIALLLRDEAKVVLELPRRHTLAVEDLATAVLLKVRGMGATVEPDYQYSAEPAYP